MQEEIFGPIMCIIKVRTLPFLDIPLPLPRPENCLLTAFPLLSRCLSLAFPWHFLFYMIGPFIIKVAGSGSAGDDEAVRRALLLCCAFHCLLSLSQYHALQLSSEEHTTFLLCFHCLPVLRGALHRAVLPFHCLSTDLPLPYHCFPLPFRCGRSDWPTTATSRCPPVRLRRPPPGQRQLQAGARRCGGSGGGACCHC